MSGVTTAVIAGAAVLGAGATVYAANKASAAASDQVNAAQNATQLQAAEFNVQQQNEAPWLKAGNTALQQLVSGFSPDGKFTKAPEGFTNSPGYASSLLAGQDAIKASAAASGRALNPGTLKALGQYTVDASLQDYNTWFSQQMGLRDREVSGLESIAGTGMTAVQGSNEASSNYANNVGNLDLQIGNARAAGRLGGATAVSGFAGMTSNMAQNYMNQKYFSNLFNSGGGGIDGTGMDAEMTSDATGTGIW